SDIAQLVRFGMQPTAAEVQDQIEKPATEVQDLIRRLASEISETSIDQLKHQFQCNQVCLDSIASKPVSQIIIDRATEQIRERERSRLKSFLWVQSVPVPSEATPPPTQLQVYAQKVFEDMSRLPV